MAKLLLSLAVLFQLAVWVAAAAFIAWLVEAVFSHF